MTTNTPAPATSPSTTSRASRRGRFAAVRRAGGALLAAGAVGLGGASLLPATTAEAAGPTTGLRHVATTPAATAVTTVPTSSTSAAVATAAGGITFEDGRPRLRIRLDGN